MQNYPKIAEKLNAQKISSKLNQMIKKLVEIVFKRKSMKFYLAWTKILKQKKKNAYKK